MWFFMNEKLMSCITFFEMKSELFSFGISMMHSCKMVWLNDDEMNWKYYMCMMLLCWTMNLCVRWCCWDEFIAIIEGCACVELFTVYYVVLWLLGLCPLWNTVEWMAVALTVSWCTLRLYLVCKNYERYWVEGLWVFVGLLMCWLLYNYWVS